MVSSLFRCRNCQENSPYVFITFVDCRYLPPRFLPPFSILYSRYYSPSTPILADLPFHIVVGMPALSPTMETGILAEWYFAEGQEFSAGDAIAKIETDKASMDYEAQDDGILAKILAPVGSDDLPIGSPIMVTVEEMADVAAFSDFVAPQAAAVAAPTPEPAAAAAPSPTPPAPKVEAAAPPPLAAAAPPAPAPAAAVPPPTMESLVAAVAPVMSTGWGGFAKINSPLAKTLSKSQQAYVTKYGTTGHLPL
jgi:pyruvate dehydrogenase E2 component (dihydrolipoamide acetyltransferase)